MDLNEIEMIRPQASQALLDAGPHAHGARAGGAVEHDDAAVAVAIGHGAYAHQGPVAPLIQRAPSRENRAASTNAMPSMSSE